MSNKPSVYVTGTSAIGAVDNKPASPIVGSAATAQSVYCGAATPTIILTPVSSSVSTAQTSSEQIALENNSSARLDMEATQYAKSSAFGMNSTYYIKSADQLFDNSKD
jgi:hypothetical protein